MMNVIKRKCSDCEHFRDDFVHYLCTKDQYTENKLRVLYDNKGHCYELSEEQFHGFVIDLD